MALHFDFTEIKDRENVCYVEAGVDEKTGEKLYQHHPVLETLIWASLGVDLSGITEKNLSEWEWRLAALDVATGGPAYNLTAEDIAPFVGLKVNVCTERRPTFKKKLMKLVEREVSRELSRRKKKAAEAA